MEIAAKISLVKILPSLFYAFTFLLVTFVFHLYSIYINRDDVFYVTLKIKSSAWGESKLFWYLVSKVFWVFLKKLLPVSVWFKITFFKSRFCQHIYVWILGGKNTTFFSSLSDVLRKKVLSQLQVVCLSSRTCYHTCCLMQFKNFHHIDEMQVSACSVMKSRINNTAITRVVDYRTAWWTFWLKPSKFFYEKVSYLVFFRCSVC